MAQTVSELLVRIRPDGTEDTSEALDDMSESFENTADSAGEQLGMLEEFSRKWRGAMQVVVAGLAVASAGLAANIPVLGELFGVISGFLTALGLQIDNFIGPTLRPLISAVWEFNNSLASLDGPLATVVGAAGTLATFLGLVVAPIAAILSHFGLLAPVVAGLSSALSTLIGAIAAVVTAIVGFVAAVLGVSAAVAAAIVVLIAAIVAFALAYITNFRGVRDKTNEFVGQVIQFIKNMASTIATTFMNLVNRAFRAGRSIIDGLIDGLQSRLSALRRMANRVAGIVRDYLPGSPAKTGPLSDLDRVGPGLVDTVAGGMERSTGRLATASGRVATATDPRGGGMGGGGQSGVMRQLQALVREMGNNRIETVVNLDSRELARGVEPLIARGAVNSGSTQVRR